MKKIPFAHLAAAVILLAVTGMQASGAQAPSPQAKPPCNSASFGENYQLGAKLLHQEMAIDAVPYLETAHQMCPSDYSAGRDLVIAYGKSGSMQKAATIAQEILSHNDVAELHSLLGELYAERGDLRPAAEQYQQAAQLDPSEDNIFDFGTSLLRFAGDSALRIFRFGVEKYPNSEKMHLGLGSALYEQGLIDEAVTEAYKASEINPTDAEPLELLGKMGYIPPPLTSAVIQRLSALCKLYPHNARLVYYYAMALSGRWSNLPATESSRVLEMLKTATEMDPAFAEAYFQLGQTYQEQDRPVDALLSYQQAVKFGPQQESYHYRLALAYKKCGHAEESHREMQIYQK